MVLCPAVMVTRISKISLCFLLDSWKPLFSYSCSGPIWEASTNSNIEFSCSGSGFIWAASSTSNISFSCSGSGSIWTASSNIPFSCFCSGPIWAASLNSKISLSNLSITASTFTAGSFDTPIVCSTLAASIDFWLLLCYRSCSRVSATLAAPTIWDASTAFSATSFAIWAALKV